MQRLLLLLAFFTWSTVLQAQHAKSVNMDSVYYAVWDSDWEDINVSAKLVPEIVKHVRSNKEHRRSPRLCVYVARQAYVYFSGLPPDSLRNILDFCEETINLSDSAFWPKAVVLNCRASIAQSQGFYDSAYRINSKAVERGKIAVMHANEREKPSAVSSLGVSYANMGFNLFSTTDFDDSQEKRNTVGPQLIRLFMIADSLSDYAAKLKGEKCFINLMNKLNIANIYGHYYQNEVLSEKYFKLAYDKIIECNDSVKLCQLYNSIAYTKLKAKDTTSAIYAAKKAIELSAMSPNAHNKLSRNESNHILSMVAFSRMQYDTALYYAQQMFADSIYLKKPGELAQLTAEIADMYVHKKDFREAVKYLTKSRKFLNRFNLENQQRKIVDAERTKAVKEIIEKITTVQDAIDGRDKLRHTLVLGTIGGIILLSGGALGVLLYRREQFKRSLTIGEDNLG